MERMNMVIDASPFLLLEATGDSEADSDQAIMRDPGLARSMAYDECGGGDDYGEDAESCSSEWPSHESFDNHDVQDLDCGGTVDEIDRWRGMRPRETGKNERVEQQRWPEAEEPCVSEEINSFDDEEEINMKPSGILSSEVDLSEIEKSRLFWEACLAS
ncbi:hypothetical protein NL676_023398 [Syzygium grande]|nr:hypothetical protein NL676_023398 [Syzygium grande]